MQTAEPKGERGTLHDWRGTKETLTYLGISLSTLNRMRSMGRIQWRHRAGAATKNPHLEFDVCSVERDEEKAREKARALYEQWAMAFMRREGAA